MDDIRKGEKNHKSGTVKLPRLFRKPVPAEKWQKKFIKKLYLPEDRKFLSELASDQDGYISISAEKLDKKDLKRLKKLAKAIRTNRRKVNVLVILIIAVIVVTGAVWELYLKNRVARQVVEQQLEKIFLADVNAENTDLKILRGAFSTGPLVVADAASPMTNLVEFEEVAAALDVRELLSGRIRILEIGFSGLKAGTPRAVSGRLSSDEAGGESPAAEDLVSDALSGEDSGSDPIADVINRIGVLAGEIDVEDLLQQQKQNLESFTVIDASLARVNEASEEWEEKASEWETRLTEWDKDISYVTKLNTGSFNSVEKAATAVERLQRIYSRAEKDYADVQKDISKAVADIDEASGMRSRIEEAVEHDYAYVEALVLMPDDQKVNWVASVLEHQLSMPITRYLGWLEKGLVWYERFSAIAEKKSRLAVNRKRTGRSLPESGAVPPGLVIEHAFASGEAAGVSYDFNLYDLVDDPARWDREPRLNAVWTEKKKGNYKAESRPSGLDFVLTGLPYAMGDLLADLGIGNISGRLSARSEIRWKDDDFNGRINVELPEILLDPSDKDNLAYRLISTSLEAASPVAAAGDFVFSEPEGLIFSLDASADEMLGRAADALIEEGAGEGVKLLKQYLSDELAGPLNDFGIAEGDLEGLVDEIAATGGELDSLMALADRKIAEAEKYAADTAAGQLENLLPPGSTDAIDKAAEDVKKGLGGLLNF